MENIENEDLYELLGVELTASTNDIKKAYRKKALSCHPDKNKDNPNAAAEFHKLTKILEILSDESARKAYDRVLKARKEAALRTQALDSKRRKLKEDLELKEKHAAKHGYQANKTPDQQLKEEIERLRKEGSKQVEEEMQYVLEQIRKEQESKAKEEHWDSSEHRIRIKWKSSKSDSSNGGYNYDLLHRFLSKYGDIVVLVVSNKKKGSGLVEFNNRRAAEMAVDLEKGLATNPLQLQWVNPESQATKYKSTTIKESDFESVVLTKMRQAEERKQLIAQMMAEDNES